MVEVMLSNFASWIVMNEVMLSNFESLIIMAAVMLSNFAHWIVMSAVMYFLKSYNIFRNLFSKSGCVIEDEVDEVIGIILFSL